MLDFELLRAFVAVADCGGFHRAAERLNLTQSTVSQQIKRLELEHFSIRLGVSRVREISVAFFFGNTFEK
jgi:DNA-binding transcriptional LysR family regulator